MDMRDTTAVTPALLLDGIRAVYQPVVDLRSGEVRGYEALGRGRAGSAWESPLELFARGNQLGVEHLVDWHCRGAALEGALRARMPASCPVFVNVEPRWLATSPPPHLSAVLAKAQERLSVVVEITERALVSDPAALLDAVRWIRRSGWGVALDDVGQDPASLALMPFVEPDVIKLDLRLVQDHTAADVAMIVNAVAAQAERTGALILAEGIETQEHRRRALAMGATLGQGWLLGRPGPLPNRPPAPAGSEPLQRAALPVGETPYRILSAARPTREATKDLLLPISHYLEQHALTAAEPPVLLSTFEQARHFTPGTARRYERLASHCSFVAALGVGMADHPVPGVRGGDLGADDPLAGEWTVIVVGPYFAGALVAEDLGDSGPDRGRRFRFVLSHERDLVVAAARSLLARVTPDDGPLRS
jgi:EAL domain-containing protein (putative c-di-GMP-specific phosphodiesterase class I)